MPYEGLIEETRKRLEQLEEQFNIADTDAQDIIYYEIEAEKARLRLLIKDARRNIKAIRGGKNELII